MKKVSIVVASRANYGRIKSVISAISSSNYLQLDLVLAASAVLYRFGDVSSTIKSDGFDINHQIYSVVEGETHATMVKSTSLLMSELATYFSVSRPDCVLTVADRHETLATAVAASYLNIPLIHTQGGEQTGSIDDKVRHSITKLSNYHFAATKKSAQNIISMGEDPSVVFHTGCPALDLIYDTDLSIDLFEEPLKGAGAKINFSRDYGVIVYHPVTDNLQEAKPILESLIEHVTNSSIPYVWLWPNVDAGSDFISKKLRYARDNNPEFSSNTRFVRSYSPTDYLRLLKHSRHVIGNSSSFIRECSLLAVPAVLIGDRQRSRETSSNIVPLSSTAISPNKINHAISALPKRSALTPSTLYSHCHAGRFIADLIPTLSPNTIKAPLSF